MRNLDIDLLRTFVAIAQHETFAAAAERVGRTQSAVTQQMQQRGPGAAGLLEVVEIQGCGHAPALNVPEQLELIEGFIRAAGS